MACVQILQKKYKRNLEARTLSADMIDKTNRKIMVRNKVSEKQILHDFAQQIKLHQGLACDIEGHVIKVIGC